MSRRTARRNAFVLCFTMSFYESHEFNNVLERFYSENSISEEDKEYITAVVTGVFENIEQIDGLIKGSSEKWSPERIGRTDMALIRVCVYEMLNMDNIPVNVSINEAVELARRYGADESPGFVNGVLGGINRQLNQEER